MHWTKFFIPTLKEVPIGVEAISHQLLLRAGLVHMLTAGIYSYLPLGLRVLRKIERIIREEMNKTGACEVFLPCLQPMDLWKETGRDKTMAEVIIRFEDKRGRAMCLGPTHEEVITDLVKNYVQSYRQFPVILYQIQTKFRDETRPRFGLVRACEFIMKDAYSFDRDEPGLKRNYQLMYEAYRRIFDRCGLETIIVEAEPGTMGGSVSHEFVVATNMGEDAILACQSCDYKEGMNVSREEGSVCPHCKNGKLKKQVAIELGHIFQLGTKYSQAQGAFFLDQDGRKHPMIMGCYGIGVSRLLAAIIEKNNDEKGIIWPPTVAPFDVEILPLQTNESQVMDAAIKCCEAFREAGWEVLMDDRDETPGVKFHDADLIGLPFRIIFSRRLLAEEKTELKNRKTGEVVTIGVDEILNRFSQMTEHVGVLR